jgi:uncharacterized protein
MEEHANAALTQKGFNAFAAGDMVTMKDLIADDAVWHVAGRNPHAGDYVGQQAIFGYFGLLMEKSGGTFRNEVVDILASAERTVALTRVHAERDGVRLDTDGMVAFRIRDGQVTEAWSSGFDQYVIDEFWSD